MEAFPDIIALTEKKVIGMIGDMNFPTGYQIMRKDKGNRGGGGIGLLIKNKKNFEEFGGMDRGGSK